MDVCLIIEFIIMKMCIHNADDCFEGSVSQNYDIGPSLYFMLCRSIHNYVMCVSLDREKFRLLFDVLFVTVAFIDPEISPLYQYGSAPLVSILKDRHQWFGREFRCSLS